MKRKLVNIFICLIMFFCTCIIVFVIYKKSTKISYPWYFEKLKINDNLHYGKQEDIGIAIIDSGFNENCQKYFDKEIIKYDATGENNTSDLTVHGTQMALLIGSNSKKKESIYGIDPYIQLYSIRVCNSYGITSSTYLHNALEYCKSINISIVNISLGGTSYNNEIENDIKELKDNDIFVICAAGDKKTDFLYPADYKNSYCIVSQNENGLISEDSNITSRINKIPIIVPGCNIDVLVIGLENELHITTRSGSSFATAIFSGYLALYIAKNKHKITPKIFDQVIETNIYNNGFIDLF